MINKLTISQTNEANNFTSVAITCPGCGHKGIFQIIGRDIYDGGMNRYFGQRYCPDANCRTHVFFVYNKDHDKLHTYPSIKIPFEKQGIPTAVLGAFEEAVLCHSTQCYIASAIMIRKTLEELCTDKGATGANLYQKLQSLSAAVMIPQELKDAMQDLRLLGNDAAHIEAQTYNQVGSVEIEVSIEFTKEILKAVYQYDSLLQKLRGLRRQNPQNP